MKKLGKAFLKFVIFVAGSWWGVLIHAIWFSIWLYLKLDILQLTLIVSLEAIFIGIFILMYESSESRAKQEREKRQRKKEQDVIKEDLVSDKKTEREVKEIKKELGQIKEIVEKGNNY